MIANFGYRLKIIDIEIWPQQHKTGIIIPRLFRGQLCRSDIISDLGAIILPLSFYKTALSD